MRFCLSGHRGQSLVEVIVAMAVFAVIGGAVVSVTLGSFSGLARGGEETQARALAQEALEAVRSVRDGAWNDLVHSPAKVSVVDGIWDLSAADSELIDDRFTRTISVSDVCRDAGGSIVECPGVYTDPHIKTVTVEVSWSPMFSVTRTVRQEGLLSNWSSRDWMQTDWSSGGGQSVWSDVTRYDSDDGNIDSSTGGEIGLRTLDGGCGTKTWLFDSPSNYVYDSGKIEITGGLAQLKGSSGGAVDTNIKGLWHLDELNGTIVDFSGNGNDLSNVKGLPQYGQVGKFSTSVDFNGSSSRYINNGQQTGLGITGAITVDAWVYRTSAATSNEAVVSKWRESGNKKSYALIVSGDNLAQFWLSGNGSDSVKVTAVSEVPLNQWVHLTGVYDETRIYVFQNGSLEGSVVYSGGIADKAAFVSVSGADDFAGSDAFFNGRIDEVRVSDVARWTAGFTLPSGPYGPASYPSDGPSIVPSASHSVPELDLWSGFSEAATKNGGEIYYQLSDDDGATWRYWDGGVWAAAGEGSYSTAAVVGTNISSFPTTAGRISFRAFLSGDGTERVQLDEVSVSCSQSYDWTFASANGYSYDDSKIEVADGVARLKDLGGSGSCDGTATSCPSFGTEPSCLAQSGCAWGGGSTESTLNPSFGSTLIPWTSGRWGTANATMSRVISGGNPGGYAKIQFPNTKSRVSGGYFVQSFVVDGAVSSAVLNLDWIVSQYTGSADSLTLYAFVDASSGTPVIGQEVWSSGDRTGTSGWAEVSSLDVSDQISGAGTYYLKVAAYVDYTNGGSNRSYAVGFDNVSLDWTLTSSCSGTPLSCGAFGSESACQDHASCSWAGASSYSAAWPGISPVATHATSVEAWTGFSETATKNGGEIYYQLSDDSGSSWLYWGGESWIVAGSGDYSSASTVNAHIAEFPVAGGQISFQAFLAGDGTQQVTLDGVQVSWGESSVGGYATTGLFVSSRFDMGDASPVQVVEWDESLPAGTNLQLQIRTAADAGGSPGIWSGWYGADGLGTYFTDPLGALVSNVLNGGQWVQYRAELTGDGTSTPSLLEVRVNYK
ncbi:MAG: LamG-like jellyroll fold domain-containing protein [bacterium]